MGNLIKINELNSEELELVKDKFNFRLRDSRYLGLCIS